MLDLVLDLDRNLDLHEISETHPSQYHQPHAQPRATPLQPLLQNPRILQIEFTPEEGAVSSWLCFAVPGQRAS